MTELDDILMPAESVEVEGKKYSLRRTAQQALDALRERAQVLREILKELGHEES